MVESPDAEDANRHVDEEDPVPGKIGGDKSRDGPCPGQRSPPAPELVSSDMADKQILAIGGAKQNQATDRVIIAPPIPCRKRDLTKPNTEEEDGTENRPHDENADCQPEDVSSRQTCPPSIR